MTQKNNDGPRRPRGRPRAFDEGAVMRVAAALFADHGYRGVALDDIAARTGVARPSLAAAFGTKRALHLRVIEEVLAVMDAAARVHLAGSAPLRADLEAFLTEAARFYLSGAGAARGCVALSTLPTDAVDDPEARAALASVIARMDALFASRFHLAQARGELGPDADPEALAHLSSALLQSIALRARAGLGAGAIETLIRQGLSVLCPDSPFRP